jgi:tetratricopeptide (TPR) repeat protein
MRRLQTNALVFLVVSICSYLGAYQTALSYSVKDDVEAVRAYQTKSDHNAKAAPVFQQAVDLLVKQQYRQARPLLEEVIRLDPRCTSAYSSLGYCHIWLGNYKEGAEYLAQAIGIDSNQPIYFYRRALCYFSTGQIKDAIVQLNNLLDKKPHDADALRLRGRCHRTIFGDEANAIADFSQLIKDNAFTVEALCERGNLYARINKDDQALQDYDAAIKIKPDAGDAYVGRANVFYKRQQYQPAWDNYTTGLLYDANSRRLCRVQRDLCRQYLDKNGHTRNQSIPDREYDPRTK